MTNQIRITLGLQGQQQVAAGLKQTAQDTTALGTAAAGISAELVSVTNQLRAMGEAAALATQQFQRVQLEQRGLGTTADSAAQRLRRQQDETAALGNASAGAGRQIGAMEAAVRGAVAGFGLLGLVEVGRQVVNVAVDFEGLRGKVDAASGSAQQGAARFAFATNEAQRLGLVVQDTASNYADLLASTRNLNGVDSDSLFSSLNEAGKQFNLTQQQINQNFDQVTRLAGKAKVTLDDLGGSLGNNLPQTLDAVAIGLGVTTDQLREMIASGEIAGREVLPALGDGLRRALGTSDIQRVTDAASEFQRLKNEVVLTAEALGRLALPGLAVSASQTAEELELLRNSPGAAALTLARYVGLRLQGRGDDAQRELDSVRTQNRFREYLQETPFRPALYDPSAPRSRPFYSPGQPAFGLVGENLLSFGQPSAEERAKAQRKADAEHAAALREQERIAAALTRDAEQALQADLRREETLRERVADVRIEAELIAEQLRTGKAITGAARELFVLQRQAADPATGQLRTELAKLAALEQQVQLQKEGERLAREATAARERADRQNEGFLRRNGADYNDESTLGGQFDRNARARDRRLRTLDSEYDRTQRFNDEARQSERGAGTNDEQKYRDEDLENYRAYAEEKKRIDDDYRNANLASLQAQFDGAAKVMGDIATIASAFGNKGFEAFRKVQIAQAIASTISGAIGAYMQAMKTYPAPFGAIAGGIAAAAALTAGYQQVNQLRSLAPPGRRFGGAVSAGQMVELNEGGISEVYRDARSGRQYFIPGNSGEVTPARAMSGSGGAAPGAAAQVDRRPLIQVFEQTGTVAVRAQARRLNRQDVVEIFVEEIADNASAVGRGVQNRTGRRAAGGIG